MYYQILDEQRRNILPKLAAWKDEYVLSGGTALALQINHRDSVDFGFLQNTKLIQKNCTNRFEKSFRLIKYKKSKKRKIHSPFLSIAIFSSAL